MNENRRDTEGAEISQRGLCVLGDSTLNPVSHSTENSDKPLEVVDGIR
jgi:hypothetical protein